MIDGRDLADGGQQAVAGVVAVAVVDRLEPVDVEEQQGERGSLPLGFLELERELVLEGAMVAEAGEAVDQGRPPGLAVELLDLRPLQVE